MPLGETNAISFLKKKKKSVIKAWLKSKRDKKICIEGEQARL